MTKKRSTKHALLMSALSLLLCMSMLIGSTFAWFTDSVTSAGNRIQSGKLEIQLLDAEKNSLEGEMIEWATKDGRAQDEILWEPGCTYNTEEFYIKNNGNLNLKFKFDVTGINGDAKLLEVIEFTCMADASQFSFNTGVVSVSPAEAEFDMLKGVDIDTLFYGVQHFDEYVLEPGEEVGPFVLSGHMDEEAGNDYQGLTIENIAISLLATQATGEEDSFDGVYDELAAFPYEAVGKLEEGQSAIELDIFSETETKIASAVIPADAVAEDAEKVEVIVDKSEYKANITVETGVETTAFDVTVTGLKENNTVPVKVTLKIAAGLDPATVKLYHYDKEIPCTYDPNTGYVIFESATFSPFTVVYDANSVYVPEENNAPADLPVATVVNSTEYENTDLPWGSYGQWSPTAGLDSQLEAAYTFTAVDADKASESPYANWYCDFYVKLDKDLGANEIFLGGNYGSFGWVGFHNGELTLPANEEIPLLGSVTSNPWTYAQVAASVGTFICGVGDVNNALSGATFTVMLRLTNPDDANEFYNVATINYTFE